MTAEKRNLEDQMKHLKIMSNRLEARKAEFVIARTMEDDKATAEAGIMGAKTAPNSTPMVRIKPISLPKFQGGRRDFHR